MDFPHACWASGGPNEVRGGAVPYSPTEIFHGELSAIPVDVGADYDD